jgi:hypothetical protein
MFFKLKRSDPMKFNSRFKVFHLRWWHKPIPLYDKTETDGYRKIGWVWNQKAYLVDNMVEGWVAFVKDQTPENIDVWRCSCCGMALDGVTRERLEKSIKEKQ